MGLFKEDVVIWDSGGGASGGVTAFCLSEQGSNPGTGSSFYGNAISIF